MSLCDQRPAKRCVFRFGFQDLVFLRAAKALFDKGISGRRIRECLGRLRRQVPKSQPLSAVQIWAEGQEIVVRIGSEAWHPRSGQLLFNFEPGRQVEPVALPRSMPSSIEPAAESGEGTAVRGTGDSSVSMSGQEGQSAEDLFELGCSLERTDVGKARSTYREALRLEPGNRKAALNLGKLLHDAGELDEADRLYRLVLEHEPGDVTAQYNLSVLLEDRKEYAEAMAGYRRVLELDPAMRDAHFNLARLLDEQGNRAGALRHLRIYRKLTGVRDEKP